MNGVLLDPRTGRPEGPVVEEGRGVVYNWINPDFDQEREIHRAPEHVKANLAKSAALGNRAPRASSNSWEEMIYRTVADSTAVTNVSTEQNMLTDADVPVLPAKFLTPGKVMRWCIFGRSSTVVTTPGTIIFRLRWGTLAAGTIMVASKAQRPKTTVSTNMAAEVEIIFVCRSEGPTGSVFAYGNSQMANTIGDAAAQQESIWPDVPAAVTIDTTLATACRPTIQHSVATATTAWTTHMARLEALN